MIRFFRKAWIFTQAVQPHTVDKLAKQTRHYAAAWKIPKHLTSHTRAYAYFSNILFNLCIYTAVYSQTLTAISIFKYVNIVCIIQVHTVTAGPTSRIATPDGSIPAIRPTQYTPQRTRGRMINQAPHVFKTYVIHFSEAIKTHALHATRGAGMRGRSRA